MKPLCLPVLASVLAGLFCIANTSAHGGDSGTPSSARAASAPSLTIAPEPSAISILGGVGMLCLLRRRSRARLI